ncbi:hypothetical protein [Marinobacterium nitratireducens]|uniref:hypothetical protein n=1 Tax=Marinobacterium nitratireducens TaxID=518897 RepID=UPI001E37FAE1|nr:hypothetical protein [Marinobacterium nitratireducens]
MANQVRRRVRAFRIARTPPWFRRIVTVTFIPAAPVRSGAQWIGRFSCTVQATGSASKAAALLEAISTRAPWLSPAGFEAGESLER